MKNHSKIPSIISYSPRSAADEQQWGASISPDAVTMVNTKLELDVQDNKSDELNLILQVLDGMSDLNFDHVKDSRGSPDYTWKSPEDIVTDYLTHIFENLLNEVSYFGKERRDQMSVDVVVTIPVVSSSHFESIEMENNSENRNGHTEQRTQHCAQYELRDSTRRLSQVSTIL